jgi:recombinational DNA repair protein (RecF pathway)
MENAACLTRAERKKLTSILELMNRLLLEAFAQRRLLLSISTVVKISSIAHLRDFFYLKTVGCKLSGLENRN